VPYTYLFVQSNRFLAVTSPSRSIMLIINNNYWPLTINHDNNDSNGCLMHQIINSAPVLISVREVHWKYSSTDFPEIRICAIYFMTVYEARNTSRWRGEI
jgi:hypothetical protein